MRSQVDRLGDRCRERYIRPFLQLNTLLYSAVLSIQNCQDMACCLQFTWDERRNRGNQRRHQISFETAILVFDDPYHISTQEREVEGELRWQTVGMVKGIQILLVAHTVPESGDEELIRIISARKATPQERSIYAQQN